MSAAAERLPASAAQRIDRSERLRFSFDGKPYSGLRGDTILSALYAAGLRTFSRSFKYHRRRGELCGCGQCASSLVMVDGAPGVRACGEPLREGMRVEHQNAWPSLEFDAMRATDLFGGPFTPPGFYYKTFIRPRRLWPLYESVLRRAAGLGRLRDRQGEREWATEYRRRHCDVLVVGGGLAGLSAACYLVLRHTEGESVRVVGASAPALLAALGFTFVGVLATSFPFELPWLPLLAPLAVFGIYVLVTRPFFHARESGLEISSRS